MPPNEAPGPTVNVGPGREEVCAEANVASKYTGPAIDAITPVGLTIKFASTALRHAFYHCDADHRRAPKALLDRIYAVADLDTTGTLLPHLARVRFETHRFSFDQGCEFAVVAPIFDGSTIVGFAAFHVDNPGLRRPYGLETFAVGFERALFESHRHPQRLLRVHFDVWSWLRAGCQGCLPVKWRRFNDALADNRVPGIAFDSDDQGRNIHEQLYAATMPEMFLEVPTP